MFIIYDVILTGLLKPTGARQNTKESLGSTGKQYDILTTKCFPHAVLYGQMILQNSRT